jgi:pimeloyl-ACP methyl ester carboxylesterase
VDERSFISRVESASVEDFARILARPSLEEERALRAYFGDERYSRMHATALRRLARRGARAPKGNVVVIHGIMGGELTAHKGGSADLIWVKVLALIGGKIKRLRLSEDGRSEADPQYQVQASGILKRSYGEILLELADEWNVRAFWYDWRKDLTLAAADLEAKIRLWFGPDAHVHLVAHSMGGLVARTFIRDYPARWDKMASKDLAEGGRLVMLGTPNHGSFAIPQVITGLEGMVRKLALLDLRHGLDDLLPVLNTFVGSYQMLPSPLVMPEVEWLYQASSYAPIVVPQTHLDNALRHHESLVDVVDPERMIYVAGYDQPTFSGLKKKQPGAKDAYIVTLDGDGRVPHALGFLKKVPTYFVKEGHGDLPANDVVIAATSELLRKGTTQLLPTEKPATRAVPQRELKEEIWQTQEAELDRVRALTETTRARAQVAEAAQQIDPSERELEELLTRGLLPSEAGRKVARRTAPRKPPSIEIAVVEGSIADIGTMSARQLPIDAIAVGHYIGVRPQNAEQALDLAISSALRGKDAREPLDPSRGILCEYADRGIVRGELGQPFFMADPRAPERVIALAGMGLPGRFGSPELTVLARELCWSLGRMGKRHLATVLIGTGVGNMGVAEAVRAWLRGIAAALSNAERDSKHRLQRVTFVEIDPRRLIEINNAILAAQEAVEAHLQVKYQPLDKRQIARLIKSIDARLKEDARRQREAWRKKALRGQVAVDTGPRVPTRMTVERDREGYRFGAVSETASVPERTTRLDDALVKEANDKLAASETWESQYDAGVLLGRLLLPADLREHLRGDAPIVMTMDSATARIHWEMIVHGAPSQGAATRSAKQMLDEFLGTSRGFTRQLRSTFAPPPEPPPPPQRTLRVLIVADPAADAPLPGAQQEGAALADLFRRFNTIHARGTGNRVEVTTLLGPAEATRLNVLEQLMSNEPYDVLHFAGHCVFDAAQPRRSGWIFSNDQRLTADELTRIDRVPSFVFSNACESGITRGRVSRSPGLAPGFAEAFFAKGVSNFVCTAWRIDDLAASDFALVLYARLLGLDIDLEELDTIRPAQPLYLYEAMRDARRTIASREYGVQTWGAYQHYGNPYFRFFGKDGR